MNGRPNLKKKRIRKNITCDADSISMRYGDETKPLVKSTCQLARKPSFWPLSCVSGFEYVR